MENIISPIYQPIQFFVVSFLLTWLLWLVGWFFNYYKKSPLLQLLFLFLGMAMPALTALYILYASEDNTFLQQDFLSRLHIPHLTITSYLMLFILFPATLLIATVISLVFGYSSNQFKLKKEYNIIKASFFFNIALLFLAPACEEIGWRGYGVDSLSNYMSILQSTLLFSLLWAIWHIPLLFIQGTYQHYLFKSNFLYVCNFFISMVPATILMNWLYYTNDRNIIICIVFHFILNLFSVLFQTEQFTKCIITILLSIVSSIVVNYSTIFS